MVDLVEVVVVVVMVAVGDMVGVGMKEEAENDKAIPDVLEAAET